MGLPDLLEEKPHMLDLASTNQGLLRALGTRLNIPEPGKSPVPQKWGGDIMGCIIA